MAKDIFHDVVKQGLIKEGWTITADPLRLTYEDERFEPDLAAERILIAERGIEKIAVEIKSFIGQTFRQDFYEALGQFIHYHFVLSQVEPDRQLVLAIPHTAYNNYFSKIYVIELIKKYQIPVIVYHTQNAEIVQWIK
jgi:hypothetical protein